MQQFEIKIFANPSGFQELKLNNSDNLFTKEIVEKRNFDGDYGTFKDGTFSVLFTPKAFIIDYIFNVVADAGFRDPQTHIAIAIERGYILKDAYQVFTNLRKEFNLIAAEYKVNIARSLYNKSDSFNKIVEDNIGFAPDQYRISTNGVDVTKRALASYETAKQLNSLLEEPNRLKFKSYSLVYFLKKIDASELYQMKSIKNNYAGIQMNDEDFNSHVSYKVVFPNKESINITSRYDEIDYTCNKKYYKSERFYGKLDEHIEDWKVTRSEDWTEFYIGKELEPEKKEIKIQCYDSKKNPVKAPSSLRFDKGTFDHEKGILVLTGSDIGSRPTHRCDDPSIRVKQLDQRGDSLSFEITKLYTYDVSKVFDFVQKKTGETISEIKIYRVDNPTPLKTLSKKDPCYYDEVGPDKMVYEIPETKKYSSTKAGFAPDNCKPREPQFKKKDTADIELIIKNESIVRNLNKRQVYCQYKNAHEEGGSEKFKKDGHLVLKEQPLGEFSYKIEIHGFRTVEEKLNLPSKQKSIELCFKKTPWNKYKGKVAIFLIGLVLGGLLRPYIESPRNGGIDNGQKAEGINVPQYTINELNHRIEMLSNENASLQIKIKSLQDSLKQTKVVFNEVNNQTDKSPNDKISNEASSKSGSHHDIIIRRIIQLPNNDKAGLKIPTSYVYKTTYAKLSSEEKKAIDDVIQHPAYSTTVIPKENKTIADALDYLNSKLQ